MKKKFKLLGFSLLLLGSLFYVLFYSEDSFFYLLKLKRSEQQLQTDIAQLAQENNQLMKEIQDIKNETFFLEKVARDELGLVKEKELVIIFQ